MLPFKQAVYTDHIARDCDYILVGDIGGTNSNFGFFKPENNNMVFVFSMHFKSKDIQSFPDVIQDIATHVKREYGITISRAGFAAAGIASQTRDYSKPTNLNLVIDAQDITKKTGIACAFVVNDFEVIGYGLDLIAPADLVLVNKGKPRAYSNQGILGAGTGLGKCIMLWDNHVGRHVPVASEGGHADFAPHNQLELDLVNFIKKTENKQCPVSWEDLLSGYGIERMYKFFHELDGDGDNGEDIRGFKIFQSKQKNSGENWARDLGREPNAELSPHPDQIFNSREQDAHAARTFELYTQLYARCAKNFALEALALGGIYIAGGIAAKNLPLFKLEVFMEEFVKCGKQQGVLQQIPIYVITDYNISLYGAARYMLLEW
jgi:glucokinase